MTDHFISSFGQKPPALGRLRINPEIGTEILESLKSRGHILSVNTGSLSAAPCVISLDPATGKLQAAGDPRAGRHALAYSISIHQHQRELPLVFGDELRVRRQELKDRDHGLAGLVADSLAIALDELEAKRQRVGILAGGGE